MFEFIKKLNFEENKKIDFNRGKTSVLETNFENLKQLEQKDGFSEKEEKNRTNYFFNQGKLNDWNLVLSDEIKKNIENYFYKEMKEIGYIK